MPSFFTAYVRAALWSSTDDAGEPLDKNHNPSNIAPETLGKMKEDCLKFQRLNAMGLVGLDDEEAGNDFWLTRNGHGAGFWDGDYPEDVGERLTRSAESFGTFDMYIGDDGLIRGV